jgi:hypothetical protein
LKIESRKRKSAPRPISAFRFPLSALPDVTMQPCNDVTAYSVSPSGERFPIPAEADYAQEFARVEALASQARAEGKEVVVVMGLGFVGAVMAAIVADARVRSSPLPASGPC